MAEEECEDLAAWAWHIMHAWLQHLNPGLPSLVVNELRPMGSWERGSRSPWRKRDARCLGANGRLGGRSCSAPLIYSSALEVAMLPLPADPQVMSPSSLSQALVPGTSSTGMIVERVPHSVPAAPGEDVVEVFEEITTSLEVTVSNGMTALEARQQQMSRYEQEMGRNLGEHLDSLRLGQGSWQAEAHQRLAQLTFVESELENARSQCRQYQEALGGVYHEAARFRGTILGEARAFQQAETAARHRQEELLQHRLAQHWCPEGHLLGVWRWQRPKWGALVETMGRT